MNSFPIGIFDSGVGGLTVLKEVAKYLPNESIIYIGDTARVPYGSLDKSTIEIFSLELLRFLHSKKVKCIVVACNTISATCINLLQKNSDVQVINVIDPSVKVISSTTVSKSICVIGTEATINSGIYSKKIHEIDKNVRVQSVACPLLVPIIEEGITDSFLIERVINQYLGNLEDFDTLHLGCTHYPFIKEDLARIFNDNVKIIDSAAPVAEEVRSYVYERGLSANGIGEIELYFTDLSKKVLKNVSLWMNGFDYRIKKVGIN